MAIIEDNSTRLKITDDQGDSIMVHNIEPDGSAVVTCHDGDGYTAVFLTNEERIALLRRLGASAWSRTGS